MQREPMNTALTSEDIKLASKYIRHCERNAKTWVWIRWFFLAASILLVGASLYYFTKANELHDKNTSGYIFGTPNSQTDLLNKYIDARIELLQLELALKLKMIIPTIIGGVLLGLVLGTWKRHEQNKLTAKALRILVQINNKHGAEEAKSITSAESV